MNLQLFCILCLCIILCDSVRKPVFYFEIKSSVLVVIIICMTLDLLDLLTFDPEVLLSDDTVGHLATSGLFCSLSNWRTHLKEYPAAVQNP